MSQISANQWYDSIQTQVLLIIFLHQTNMVDNNKQYKPNQIKQTITAQKKSSKLTSNLNMC